MRQRFLEILQQIRFFFQFSPTPLLFSFPHSNTSYDIKHRIISFNPYPFSPKLFRMSTGSNLFLSFFPFLLAIIMISKVLSFCKTLTPSFLCLPSSQCTYSLAPVRPHINFNQLYGSIPSEKYLIGKFNPSEDPSIFVKGKICRPNHLIA